MTLLLPPWRCWQCRKLLMRVIAGPGSVIEIECPRCGTVNTIDKREKPAA